MIMRKVDGIELYEALTTINQLYFQGNAKFFDGTPEQLGNKAFRVRLAVHNNDGPGAIRTVSKGWRSPYACWHLHGQFFINLPEEAVVYSRGRKFKAHDKWEDWNAGSMMCPVMQSSRCMCDVEGSKIQFTPVFDQMDSMNFVDELLVVEYDHEKLETQLEIAELEKHKAKIEAELKKRAESADDVYMRLMQSRINNFK